MISAALNFSLYILNFVISNNIILSSVAGYLLGIITSFYFGEMWVFNLSNIFTISELVRYLIVYFLGRLGMTLIIFLLNQDLGIDYKLSWIGGILFSISNNYLGSKYIVFKEK